MHMFKPSNKTLEALEVRKWIKDSKRQELKFHFLNLYENGHEHDEYYELWFWTD